MRVLSVVHHPGHTGGGGLFETVAEELGHRHERWHAPDGRHEDDPAAYDAIMVFGGYMHPDQDAEHPWLQGEADFIRAALDERVPMLGVCLGSQLLARAAGASVFRSTEPEVGWLPVELTEAAAADPVAASLPERFDAFQWHHYTHELPAGAVELARSRVCLQAFRLGDAWGVQFHPEVRAAQVEAWLGEDPDDVDDPQALREATRERIDAWNDLGRRLCAAFLAAA